MWRDKMQSMNGGIKNIGSVLETDANGYIVKTASIDKIQPEWRPAVDAAVEAYKHNLGDILHSVYVRGSVAKGEAIEGVSDIDTMALVTVSRDRVDTDWEKKFRSDFAEHFPFVNGVEILIKPVDRLGGGDKILITTQTVCLYGEDIAPQLPPLKPGRDMVMHAFTIEQEINQTIAFLQSADNPERITQKCTWIMKRMVRTGCELVMERSRKYTRDLYPCYELFTQYYPKQSDGMYRVLELAIYPTTDNQEIVGVLESFGGWIAQETRNVFKDIF